jgi:hypothetical protein
MESPAYSAPLSQPPQSVTSASEFSDLRIDSPVNRELIMDAIRLLELYTHTERGRGRGRPTNRVRDQQQRCLDLLAESLETLR